MRAGSAIVALWQALGDFFYPPHCPECGAYAKQRGSWCQPCLDKVLRLRRLPLEIELAAKLTGGAWAVGVYEGGLRRLIRQLKYHQDMSATAYIYTLLHFVEKALPSQLSACTLAVPVPLYKDKEKERGFNQAEVIFREWVTQMGLPWQRALLRQKETKPQYGLDRQARKYNVAGAFSLAAEAKVRQQHVLLVDDIMTTGATLSACADVMRCEGASSVTALVLASGRK